MKYCRYCGAEISEETQVCPNCKKVLKDKEKNEFLNITKRFIKKDNKNTKIVLILCVIIFIVFGISFTRCKASGCGNKTVSGSGYCYSHKCVISSCNDVRFSLSNYCYTHYLWYDEDAKSGIGNLISYDLNVSNITLSNSGSYTIAKGTFTNNSDYTVEYVKIKGAFVNSSGKVVDTDWTYAVGSEGLSPGESCTWRMSVDKNSSIKKCNVTILDYDY